MQLLGSCTRQRNLECSAGTSWPMSAGWMSFGLQITRVQMARAWWSCEFKACTERFGNALARYETQPGGSAVLEVDLALLLGGVRGSVVVTGLIPAGYPFQGPILIPVDRAGVLAREHMLQLGHCLRDASVKAATAGGPAVLFSIECALSAISGKLQHGFIPDDVVGLHRGHFNDLRSSLKMLAQKECPPGITLSKAVSWPPKQNCEDLSEKSVSNMSSTKYTSSNFDTTSETMRSFGSRGGSPLKLPVKKLSRGIRSTSSTRDSYSDSSSDTSDSSDSMDTSDEDDVHRAVGMLIQNNIQRHLTSKQNYRQRRGTAQHLKGGTGGFRKRFLPPVPLMP